MHRERKLDRFPHEELEQLSFTADKVVLYQSELRLHHVVHMSLLEINLE